MARTLHWTGDDMSPDHAHALQRTLTPRAEVRDHRMDGYRCCMPLKTGTVHYQCKSPRYGTIQHLPLCRVHMKPFTALLLAAKKASQ